MQQFFGDLGKGEWFQFLGGGPLCRKEGERSYREMHVGNPREYPCGLSVQQWSAGIVPPDRPWGAWMIGRGSPAARCCLGSRSLGRCR